MIYKKTFHHIALIVIVLIVYGNTFSHGFVWDDYIFLVNNDVYVNFDLKRILFSLANGVEYLPIRDLSYALDYAVWGNSATGFHVTNVILYWLTIIAVYIFTGQLSASLYGHKERASQSISNLIPFVTALLFAVHPLHSELASFITCRNALLSALFFVASCCFYLWSFRSEKYLSNRYYVLALSCFLLSLLSKATGITLPLIILLICYFESREEKQKGVIRTLPFFILSFAAFFFFKSIAQQSYILRSSNSAANLEFVASKLAVAVQIPLFYLGKLLLPLGLSAEYDTQFDSSLVSAGALFGLLVTTALIAVALRYRKGNPELLFCTAWFFSTLIPVSNIFSTHPIVADRYVFLPSFACCYILAATLLKAGGEKGARLKPVVASAVIIIWGALAMNRNMVWSSNKSLWEATAQSSPRSVNANSHLGRIYFIEGEYDRAFYYLGTARELNPHSPEYDFFKGYLMLVRQDFPRAMDYFRQALIRDADFIEALYFMGKACEAVGNRTMAAESYRKALLSHEPDVAKLKPLAAENLKKI